ncbi:MULTISPECIES: putative entry exclusion protein TrbK-alt [Actibacterium]|uniref:Conjugative transfer region protein TrbK n=1 Tax=Actibacterium naphthalenivorans TaxID=1614693 RepID=A0A840CDF2_9RHOB|nr:MULTISPECIES: putative entry exclusion protein TrbK-alt [Actibacterium]ALG90025.1 conjugal transfer protein TrbK [Actibacterium sp. EMB200-NS6]MBB4024121.1 conjugative transfer region protein TrbK [Actibacterium naphthalenivorans]
MEGSVLARIAAIVFVAIAITAALVEMGRDKAGQAVRPTVLVAPEPDPLRAEQRRCQELGEAAASDPDCLAVWAETRDRFLGRDRTGAE